MRNIFKFMGLLALPLAFAAQAQKLNWDWSEKATYLDTHDPMVILLDGDRELEVIYDALAYEDVDKWSKGKQILLAYSAKTGTVLFDPESGKSLPIINGLKEHPIDVIMTRCKDAPDISTVDIRECNIQGYELWDAEMNLWYGRLMAKDSELLDDSGKQKLKQAQRQWLRYRDAQFKVISAIYGQREGTIWVQVAQDKRLALPKNQALHLTSYFQIF